VEDLVVKVRIAIKAMNPDFDELIAFAESQGKKSTEEIIREANEEELDKYNVEEMKKASIEFYGFLARHTTSEAAIIVRSVKTMEGLETWNKLYEAYTGRTIGRLFRLQRECMYPRPSKDVAGVRVAILNWEERWRGMMSELQGEARIPSLWKMSALLEVCPKEVKDQMMLRIDEVDEDYEKLKARILSYVNNRVEQ
jgi:hypothetical protein